jgi:hypothetical protein
MPPSVELLEEEANEREHAKEHESLVGAPMEWHITYLR